MLPEVSGSSERFLCLLRGALWGVTGSLYSVARWGIANLWSLCAPVRHADYRRVLALLLFIKRLQSSTGKVIWSRAAWRFFTA